MGYSTAAESLQMSVPWQLSSQCFYKACHVLSVQEGGLPVSAKLWDALFLTHTCRWHRSELKRPVWRQRTVGTPGILDYVQFQRECLQKKCHMKYYGLHLLLQMGCWGAQPLIWGCLLCRVSRAPRPLSLQVRTAADDVLANVQRGNYTVLHKLLSEFQSDAGFFTVLNCFVLWLLILWCGSDLT